MWIENTARKKSQTETQSYIKLNLEPGNPALRISEHARNALGWKHNDHCNIFIDEEKIIIVLDNKSKNFALSLQKTKEKKYGLAVYGHILKETFPDKGWKSKKNYPIKIVAQDGDLMIICFKEEIFDKAQQAIREHKIKRLSKSG